MAFLRLHLRGEAKMRILDPGAALGCWVLMILMTTTMFCIPAESCTTGDPNKIVNCSYGDTTSQTTCESSGCCWDDNTTPSCFLYVTEIKGFDVTIKYRLPETIFHPSATEGSDVTIFLEYGDSKTLEESWFGDINMMTSFNMTYPQRKTRYDAIIWASNNQSWTMLERKVCYFVDPVAGSMAIRKTDISQSPFTYIDSNLTAGQPLELTADMGDNRSVVMENYSSYSDIPNPWSYKYASIGKYDVNISVCTCFNCLTFEFVSLVGIPITGFALSGNSTIPLAEEGRYWATLGNSSETTCTFAFSDDANSVTVHEVFTGDRVAVAHAFSEIGSQRVVVFCENLFGNVTGTFDVVVLDRKITDMTVRESADILTTGSEVKVDVTVGDGSNINYTVDFDDGDGVERLYLASNSPTSWSHTYMSEGKHNVLITAENSISRQSITKTIIVQNPFIREQIQVAVNDAIKQETEAGLQITIYLNQYLRPPTDGYVNITYQGTDQHLQDQIQAYPYTLSAPRCDAQGPCTLHVLLYNLASNVSFEIERPAIHLSDQPILYARPLSVFQADVSLAKSYTIKADFGDGHIEDDVSESGGFRSFNFSGYVYPKPGIYTVKVTIAYDIVRLVAEGRITVIAFLPDMNLITNSPLAFDSGGTRSTFKLEIKEEDRLPFDCVLNVDFDDDNNISVSKYLGENISWSHTFYSTKYYHVKINVSTIFDYKYIETIFTVQIPVSEVEVLAKVPGEGEQEDTFFVATPIQFTASHRSGTGANYSWYITNSDSGSLYHHQVTKDRNLLLTIKDYGRYLVRVVVDNGLGTPRHATRRLEVVPNGIITKFDFPPTGTIGEHIVFKLELWEKYNRPPYSFNDVCIKFRLGNDFFWISSKERYCLDLADQDYNVSVHQVRIEPGSGAYSIRHHFTAAGPIPVYVSVTDKEERFSDKVSGKINITYYCLPPNVEVRQVSVYGFRSKVIFVSMENFFIDIECVATNQIYKTYALYRYLNKTESLRGNDMINGISTIQRGDGLYIEELQLAVGYYAVNFTLGMGTLEHGPPELATTVTLDLQVLPTDFRVSFEGGIYREVTAPDDVNLVAVINNPDNPGQTDGFQFTWFCYNEAESDWATDNVRMPTDAKIIDIPNNGSHVDAGLGGCFNTGPGVLFVSDLYSNTLSVNTSYMAIDNTYVFEVIVTKGDKQARAKTSMSVRSQPSLDVIVNCAGANCFQKVNIDDVYLLADCATCSNATASTFTWSVTSLSEGKRKRRSSELRVIESRKRTSTLKISSSYLTEGAHYQAHLKVEQSPNAEGNMYYEFYVNFPPRGGTCLSDISEGNTSTVFTFTCINWQDEGKTLSDAFQPATGAQLKTSFSYFTHNGAEHRLAGYRTTLPSGDPNNDYLTTVRGYITDMFGCSVHYDFAVKVEPLSDNTIISDKLDSLHDAGVAQNTMMLDTTLDTLAVLTSELNTNLAALMQNSKYALPGPNIVYTPAGSVEQQVALQQQQSILEAFDSAVTIVKDVVASDEVDLSPNQLVDIVDMLATVEMPKRPLSNTMSSMFVILGSLSEKISQMDIDMNDPQSVSRAQVLTQGVAHIIDKSISSSSDVLVHKKVTSLDFRRAVLDVGMTEEYERKYLEMLQQREAAIADVQSKSWTSLLDAGGVITRMMTLTSVTSSTMTTSLFSAGVSKVTANRTSRLQFSDAYSTQLSLASPGDMSSGDLVLRVLLFDKSALGVGENDAVDGPVLYFMLSQERERKKVTNTTFEFAQKLKAYEDIPRNCSEETVLDEDTGMRYLSVPVHNHSTYSVVIDPERPADTKITVYVVADCVNVIDCRPNRTYYSYKKQLPSWNQNEPWQASFADLSDIVYVGIDITDSNDVSRPTSNFCMRSAISWCRGFDSEHGTWTDTGSSVSEDSTLGTPKCISVTSPEVEAFSSGFKIPTVNPIDFKRIFAHFAELLGDNSAVFATVVVVIVIYLLTAVWARHADRKDIEKWSVLPLVGNQPHYRNFYKITVFTGLRRWAGTKSNVYFILSGEMADTDVRELKDTRDRGFSTGSIRHFTLATNESLGELIYLRIWHDNSGKGDHASWFLDKVVVEDLQTKLRYFFLCGRWLAVDEDDGLIDRILPVAGRDDIIRFEHLFFDKARRKLFDDHLWLSIVGRPSRSNFTRLQRLTCILCLLFTTMLANAMWYGRVEVTNDRVLVIGPITLSAATILVSVFGALTVVPVNTLVIMLFRKHRPKDWQADDEVIGERGQRIQVQRLGGTTKTVKWWKQKYPLPYWCAYIAWALAILCSLTGMLFIVLYSLQWGKEKSNKWLSSLLISTVQSVVLIQPVKVILLAAVLSLIAKTLDDDDDDVSSRHNNAKVGNDEEFTDEHLIRLNELVRQKKIKPLNDKELAKARKKRRNEKQMWTLVKEGTSYFLFLLLLSFIVWGSRPPGLYHSNRALLREIAGGELDSFTGKVYDGHHFWNWSRSVLTEYLFYMKRYNGEPGSPRERQFLSDGISFRVGPLIMRQVRVKPGFCQVMPRLSQTIKHCSNVYSFMNEDNRNFTLKWDPDQRENSTDENLSRLDQAFKYKSFAELKNIPFSGKLATYGGGGYVANLGTTKGQASSLLDDLLDNNWLDYYTRAIFVEFTVYNPNINSFSRVTFLFESPATGAIVASARVITFRLFTQLSGMSLLVVACQVIFMVLITWFMIHEALQFRRLGKQYWRNPWNYLEIAIISMSWATFAIYLLHEIVGRLILDVLMHNKEEYTNVALFAYYDEIQWYIVGIIVFLCDIKFLRLLRFNKHIAHLLATLSHSTKDLTHFMVSFSLIFMAFTGIVYLLFSDTQKQFISVITVMESLFAMLIGKFDVGNISFENRTLGRFIFGLYAVLIYFITINMFLAIIGDSYKKVSHNPACIGDDYKVVAFIVDKAFNYLGIRKQFRGKKERYMNSLETLQAHLDILDQFITNECRVILRQERQAMMTQSSCDKEEQMKEDTKTMKKIAVLSKLRQQCTW